MRKTKWWGKDPGPDGLNIEGYTCNEDLLAPLLTDLFNACMHSGVVPAGYDKTCHHSADEKEFKIRETHSTTDTSLF